jgi:hypothetical protein
LSAVAVIWLSALLALKLGVLLLVRSRVAFASIASLVAIETLYLTGGLIEFLVSGARHIEHRYFVAPFDMYFVATSCVCMTATLFFYRIAALYLDGKLANLSQINKIPPNSNGAIVVVILYFLVFYFIYRDIIIFEFLYYGLDGGAAFNSGFYNIVKASYVLFIGVSFIKATLAKSYSRIAIFFILIFSTSVVLKDKNALVFFVIAATWLGATVRLKQWRLISILYTFCAIYLSLIMSGLFSIVRGGGGQADFLSRLSEYSSFKNFDSFGPMAVGNSLVSNFVEVSNPYVSYLNGLLPRFFSNAIGLSKRRDLAQEYASNIIPNWEIGMGMGFSPIGEAYLIAGAMAPVYMIMVISIAYVLLRIVARALFEFFSSEFDWVAFHVIIAYFFLLYMRSYSLVLFKIAPIFLILFIFSDQFGSKIGVFLTRKKRTTSTSEDKAA